MKIYLNEIFSTQVTSSFKNWNKLTKGRHLKGYNPYKGMPYHSAVRGIIPSINFHINPFKEDGKNTPWRDLVFQEEGRVVYNGDNKSSEKKAHETKGNKISLSVAELYKSKDRIQREKAPPIIITRTKSIDDKIGYREFIGFGIISSIKLVQQYEKNTNKVFSNFQYVVILFKLNDGEFFDWTWIDDRRDSSIDISTANKRAPLSWRRWISEGHESVESNRLQIKKYHLFKVQDQKKMPSKNQRVLDELLSKHYPDALKDGIRFEAMASFITTCFFEEFNYSRGWITKGSGDRGVDFVGKLKIGDNEMSQTSVIVLGQSKRYKDQISGEKVTRIASRMTRGYIGVVVTLGTISIPAQREIYEDKLPIILINGKKVTELLLNYMNEHRVSLEDLVMAQDDWAQENIGGDNYNAILEL